MVATLLNETLERAALRSPEHVAVMDGNRALTYAELNERSNGVAQLLVDNGATVGERVGLCLQKSIELVVGLYGVLKAGACYVPLDPHAPARRLQHIARDCGLRFMLTGPEVAVQWPAGLRVMQVSGGRAQQVLRLPRPAGPDDLAYILYTSGSTGDPKGVMLSHRNGLAFVGWAAAEFGIAPGDRVSWHAPLHFDLSVFDVFAAAAGGATLVLVPPERTVFPAELAWFMEANRITVWYSVPSQLSLLLRYGNLAARDLSRLRVVLFAGEVFPPRHLRQLMGLLPAARFANLYGPTETNVCTWHDVSQDPPAGDDAVPIGRAIPGAEVFAVTDRGRRAGPGEIGELYVRGPSVTRGYWGDPERSRQALVPALGGEIAYRTGDLVRAGDDGVYWFVGRRDHQVKSRGYRIELGEVEAVLCAHPAVTGCVVAAIPDKVVTNRLAACVASQDKLTPVDLARHCATRLPGYMVPEVFDVRAELPKTSAGKTDRQVLATELAALMAAADRHAGIASS